MLTRTAYYALNKPDDEFFDLLINIKNKPRNDKAKAELDELIDLLPDDEELHALKERI